VVVRVTVRAYALAPWQPAFVHLVVEQLSQRVGHPLTVIPCVLGAAPDSE
jgi:hypothetical protein